MMPSDDRLRAVRVHVGGAGRIGTEVVLALHAAGVGAISSNDPQRFEEEQLGPCVFARPADLGRPKVEVLARFLGGRASLAFVPIVAANESPKIAPYLGRADLIISCANRLEARVHLERQAVRIRKPSIQAGVEDGRDGLGGFVSVWHPEAGCSCFRCLVPAEPEFRRGEALYPSVTRTVANLAAHIAVRMLGSEASQFARRHNVFTVDLENLAIRAMSVEARPTCPVCGRGRYIGGKLPC